MATPAGESAPAAPAASPSPVAPSLTPAPRRRNLSYEEKLLVVEQKALMPNWTQETLALWAKDAFALETKPTQATISNILRASERLRAANVAPTFRSSRPVKFPELDSAVIGWVLTLLAREEPVTRAAIKQKATAVAREMRLPPSLTFSKGWVSSFLKRHQLHQRRSRQRTGPDDDGADIFLQIVPDEVTPPRTVWDVAPAVLVSLETASAADSTRPPPASSSATAASTSSSSSSSSSSTKRKQVPTRKDANAPQQTQMTVQLPAQPPAQPEVEPPLPSQQQQQAQPKSSRKRQQKQTQAPPQSLQQQLIQQQQQLIQQQQQQLLQSPPPQPLLTAPIEQPPQRQAPMPPQSFLSPSQLPAPPQQVPPTQPTLPPKKQRRQSRQSFELSPDKEKEQQLFDLERRKLQVDLEAKQVHLMVEKALARKKLLDAGISEAEVNKLIPL